MTSTKYPIDSPKWLWELFTRALDDETAYSRYNDRLVESVATDVRRFAEADLIELDQFDERRLDELLEQIQPDDDHIPAPGDALADGDGEAGDVAPGQNGRSSSTEPSEQPSSRSEPRGERR